MQQAEALGRRQWRQASLPSGQGLADLGDLKTAPAGSQQGSHDHAHLVMQESRRGEIKRQNIAVFSYFQLRQTPDRPLPLRLLRAEGAEVVFPPEERGRPAHSFQI